MQLDYYIRTLTLEDMPEMYRAFLEAFSDYQIDFKMDRATFNRRFLEKLHIAFHLSVGVFHHQKLVAFIFHTLNQYEGEKVLYNGGTGVIPAHRKKQLVDAMYQFILPIARNEGVGQSVLEVLTGNVKATNAYQRVGFTKTKLFRCFKTTGLQLKRINKEVSIVPQRIFDPGKYEYLGLESPSFQDTNQHLVYNAAHEMILEAQKGKEVVGYIVFQQLSGRISQLAVKRTYQNEGIGSRLLSECQSLVKPGAPLTLINLKEEDDTTYYFLLNRGFENQINQYEMKLNF